MTKRQIMYNYMEFNFFTIENDEEHINRLIRASKSTKTRYTCDEIEAESSEWREILILLFEKYDKK